MSIRQIPCHETCLGSYCKAHPIKAFFKQTLISTIIFSCTNIHDFYEFLRVNCTTHRYSIWKMMKNDKLKAKKSKKMKKIEEIFSMSERDLLPLNKSKSALRPRLIVRMIMCLSSQLLILYCYFVKLSLVDSRQRSINVVCCREELACW